MYLVADINECELGDAYCSSALAVCVNKVGSYSCTCIEGYQGDGVVCVGK